MFLELAWMARFGHRHGAIWLLTLLLASSCAQEDGLPGDNVAGGRPALLGINTLQAAGIEARPIVSRAVATTDYPTSKSVGFFVKADATNGYKAVDNRKGVYSSARKLWLPEAATPADSIWLNSHDADVAIYAPYDAAQTTAATLNLAACLRPSDGSKDLWCKRFAANNQSKNLSVTLEHLYTRLAVVVSRDAAYTSDATLTALSLKGNEAYQTATYQPFEAAPYTYGTSTGLAPAVAAQTLNASTASATYDLLLIPATLTGDLTLTLTVDGKQMRVAVAKEKFASTKLEAGKQYNVNLKLKPGKLEVTSVTVENWDVLAEVSGGNAEFDEIKGIDIGLSFVIAPGNLIAAPNGSGGYIYSFAEGQGYYSGVNGAAYDPAGGDYFCLNAPDPDPASYIDVPFDDWLVNTYWDDARDPCRQIDGGEWYTPTSEQCRLILDKGSVWGTYVMKDGKVVNGCYFGTTFIPSSKAKQDKYMFAPAAGYRDDDASGTICEEGTHGYYWSSTSSNFEAVNPWGFHFMSTYTGITTSHTTVNSSGLSVRCIKDKPLKHVIDIGLDFYIADGNLIATKQADGTLSYAFAEGQGYYSGVEGTNPNGGDYFPWNTLDPWAAVDAWQLSSWDDARDPCRKVADGKWRTPNQAECEALIGAGNVRGTYTMPDGAKKYGQYYGITTVPLEKDQDKYVFLPDAGDRDKHGFYEHVGSWGSYWSSTLSDDVTVWCLFGNGHSGMGRSFYLEPIRCIRDK